VPTFRPFRGLRYDRTAGDLSKLICPPYDVIGAAEREHLLGRHPDNAVRVEFPVLPGHENGGYREAAVTLRTWRDDGVMRLDDVPTFSVYEQRFRLGEGPERVQRGVFGRLRLEPFGEGIRAHERTLSAPKEDRLRLLRATATDTSPIVLLGDRSEALTQVLDRTVGSAPDAQAVDDAGVTHRLWVVDGDDERAVAIGAAVAAGAVTIADGHHRYETALRYRDESAAASTAGGGGERPEDFVLADILDLGSADGPTILPTHRVVHGDAGLANEIVRAIHGRFAVEHPDLETVVGAFEPPFRTGPRRIGVVTPRRAGEIDLERSDLGGLFDDETAAAVRALDVAVLDAMLGPFLEAGRGATLSYTHAAREAADAVRSGDAALAFLLAPTPLESVIAVAAAGAVMPQKSTFFYPKAATGLVMYPFG
jgi:uncharacterized protein (DUF1015 family)